jgi:hypothetical protein
LVSEARAERRGGAAALCTYSAAQSNAVPAKPSFRLKLRPYVTGLEWATIDAKVRSRLSHGTKKPLPTKHHVMKRMTTVATSPLGTALERKSPNEWYSRMSATTSDMPPTNEPGESLMPDVHHVTICRKPG